MKLFIFIALFATHAFANSSLSKAGVTNALENTIGLGNFESFEEPEFVSKIDINGAVEVYKLNYVQNIKAKVVVNEGTDNMYYEDEIVGQLNLCEYVYYDPTYPEEVVFLDVSCEQPLSEALKEVKAYRAPAKTEFLHNEEEISEVLQTSKQYAFVLDYEVPEFVGIEKDEFHGDRELYKLNYVTTDNVSKCEYITFDAELSYVDFIGVNCSVHPDEVFEGREQEDYFGTPELLFR